LRATVVRLALLLGAAFFGLFTWRFNLSPTDWAGVAAAFCFLSALLVELYLLKDQPERTWYEGRAAAESARTLGWRYMMGAEPFGIEGQQVDIDALFLGRLNDVLSVLKDIDLSPGHAVREQITPVMRAIRAASLEDRRSMYEVNRVGEQQQWYSRKARWNRNRAAQWTLGMLAVEGTGIAAAILKAAGTVGGELLSLGGAIVAAMTAWLQTKQYRTIAAAYSVTALELASVRSRIANQVTEADWSKFVSDAEDAISREHTLWKASRGVRSGAEN